MKSSFLYPSPCDGDKHDEGFQRMKYEVLSTLSISVVESTRLVMFGDNEQLAWERKLKSRSSVVRINEFVVFHKKAE